MTDRCRRRLAAPHRVDVVWRLRGQVGGVGAGRAGVRPAGRDRPVPPRRPGAVRRRRHLPHRRRDRARVDDRLLPAARRRPGRLRRHRRRQRVQRRLRDGRPGRARHQRRRLPGALSPFRHRRPSSRLRRRRVAEAGGTVAGGHTIRNPEPVFGLAVQGLVHPDRVFRKGGARPGDVVVLSKPLGTGLTLAGGTDEDRAAAIVGMRRLNRSASEILRGARPSRPRRHGRHRLRPRRSRLGDGRAQRRPTRRRRRRAAGLSRARSTPPSGACARAATPATATTSATASTGGRAPAIEALCFDPQTSGGLLAALDPGAAADLPGDFVVVGRVEAGEPGLVVR